MNINDIAERAHEHAKKAGFLDPRNSDSMLMDLVDEISEARKAFNENHYCHNYPLIKIYEYKLNPDKYISYFENCIKNRQEDEMTDILLITLAIMKHHGIDIEKHVDMKQYYNELRDDHK